MNFKLQTSFVRILGLIMACTVLVIEWMQLYGRSIYCDELHTHWTIYTTWIQILLVNLTEVCDLYVCVMFLCVLLFICLEWAVLFLYDTWSNSVHPSISGFLIHIILTTTKTKKFFLFNTLGRVAIVEDVLLMNMMLCVCAKLSYDGIGMMVLLSHGFWHCPIWHHTHIV